MQNQDKYHICKLLDKELRVLGLPLDEFIPIILTVVLSFILKVMLFGLVLAGIIAFTIRYFKKGKGSGWLFYKLYWLMPKWVFCYLMKTPASYKREWFK